MLLSRLAFALAAGACFCLLAALPHAHAQEGWDVIIVGAGMAGVTAARNLTNAGLRVLVLEARERPGGRLEKVQVPGGAVDLGAMWIHEAIPGVNQLLDLVNQLGLPVSPRQDYSSLATYSSTTGDRISRSSYVKVYSPFFTQLRPRIAAMKSTPGTPDQSVADVYSAWLADNPGFTADDVKLANIIAHTNWQALLNGNITKLSTLRLGDAKSIPAVNVMLKDGFPSVIDAMLNMQPAMDVRFSTVVTSIEHDEDNVTVTTSTGEVYSAPYAILTVPLGLLKEEAIDIQPPLPEPKLRAIADMGYGVLDKAVFVFPQPFWDTNADFILRDMPDWSGRWSVFLNYWKLFRIPVLVSLHVADTARELEAMTPTQLLAEGMGVLRSIYERNGTSVPDPVQFHSTQWAADPYARGSYSYFAVDNPREITDALAEPVGRLLFAGEATSRKPASVWGAHLSGLREAQRVQSLMAGASTT